MNPCLQEQGIASIWLRQGVQVKLMFYNSCIMGTRRISVLQGHLSFQSVHGLAPDM